MRNSNLYYYLLREIPVEVVAEIKGTKPGHRQILSNIVDNWEVVATLIQDQPLYQNWIYQMDSGIFIYADPTKEGTDITIDTLTAFGVPDWKDETFTQYTTIGVMFTHKMRTSSPGANSLRLNLNSLFTP